MDESEIIYELSQCREDERQAQGQIVQIVSTMGTMLSAIYAASAFIKNNNGSLSPALLFLSIIIFCVGFFYIIPIGIISAIRYHYVRDLEDALSHPSPLGESVRIHEKALHWTGFSSPVVTKNVIHIISYWKKEKFKTPLYHFVFYSGAILFAAFFCTLLTLQQYSLLSYEDQTIATRQILLGVGIFLIGTYILFLITCGNANHIYQKLKAVSLQKMEQRTTKHTENKLTSTQICKAIRYYVYPKEQDVQKMLLIVLGYLLGALLASRTFSDYLDILSKNIPNIILSVFIIDFLIYQARYMINDIRGLQEDTIFKKSRLPIDVLHEKKAVTIAFSVALFRVLLAVVICNICNSLLSEILLTSTFVIIILTICYEFSRTNQKDFWVFIFVGFGYPLRILVGIASVLVTSTAKPSFLFFFITSLAFYFYGVYSATIPWDNMADLEVQSGKKISRSHIQYLYNHRPHSPSTILGKIRKNGNISFIFATILLASFTFINQNNASINWFTSIAQIILCFLLCLSKRKTAWITICITTLLTLSSSVLNIALNAGMDTLVVSILQLTNFMTYFALRFYFDPDYNYFRMFINGLQFIKLIIQICFAFTVRMIVGKNAVKYFPKVDVLLQNTIYRSKRNNQKG